MRIRFCKEAYQAAVATALQGTSLSKATYQMNALQGSHHGDQVLHHARHGRHIRKLQMFADICAWLGVHPGEFFEVEE